MRRRIFLNHLGRILVLLLKERKIDLTTLKKKTGFSSTAIYSAIDAGFKLGLLKDEYERYPPNRRFIFLTEKGKKIAELLEKAYQILETSET